MARMTDTTSGTEREEQTPEQFNTGPEPTEDQEAPASHATKGMVTLGYTEASRIEDSLARQLAEQKAHEKALAKKE
jgi:hypothetical protein